MIFFSFLLLQEELSLKGVDVDEDKYQVQEKVDSCRPLISICEAWINMNYISQ